MGTATAGRPGGPGSRAMVTRTTAMRATLSGERVRIPDAAGGTGDVEFAVADMAATVCALLDAATRHARSHRDEVFGLTAGMPRDVADKYQEARLTSCAVCEAAFLCSLDWEDVARVHAAARGDTTRASVARMVGRELVALDDVTPLEAEAIRAGRAAAFRAAR